MGSLWEANVWPSNIFRGGREDWEGRVDIESCQWNTEPFSVVIQTVRVFPRCLWPSRHHQSHRVDATHLSEEAVEWLTIYYFSIVSSWYTLIPVVSSLSEGFLQLHIILGPLSIAWLKWFFLAILLHYQWCSSIPYRWPPRQLEYKAIFLF